MIHLHGRPRKPKPPKPPRTCVVCGKSIGGHQIKYCCAQCEEIWRRERDNEYNAQAAELRKYRAAHRLCTYCGKPLPKDETHRECADCRSFRADAENARYHRLIDNRQCPMCRKKLPEGYYYVYCPVCREKMNEKRENRRERKRGNA